MCMLPTNISPTVIRLPHLQTYEGVAAGLRADVKQTASVQGHRMTSWSAGESSCIDCKMEASVYHIHPFKNVDRGIAYKGAAINNKCPGKPQLLKGNIIQRAPALRVTRR